MQIVVGDFLNASQQRHFRFVEVAHRAVQIVHIPGWLMSPPTPSNPYVDNVVSPVSR